MSRRPKDDHYERYVHRMMARFNEDYHCRVRGHVPSDPESEEETDKPTRTQCLKPLKVLEVDTHPAKNSKENHTELYEIIHGYRPTAVLRRGFSFVLTLKFDREYEITKDIIKIKFGIGPHCVRRKNTLVCFVVTDKRQMELSSHIWDYKVIERKDKTLSLMVHISVSAPVGRWILMVETYHVQLEGTRNVTEKTDLYILFNPWHKDESVGAGMHPGGLDEYLLKDTGKVWRGTADNPEGRPWVFGQFHHVVLPAITLLLAKFDMPCDTRGDPIGLVRALSSIINARIGPTLMENRWSSDYSGGKDPASWTGSVAIFETYLRTGRPVKYGQCWVVSALVVTVCRALGIPCRSVTTYQCGHDMGDNFVLNLHKRFNKIGDIRSRYEGGSCWVYHAWNEVWMKRRDLRFGLGGWQAIDATRRSLRDDILSRESGPASVEAIKTNQKVQQYDTMFFIAILSGKVAHHYVDEAGSTTPIKCISDRMGRLVVTKHPILLDDNGEQDLKDITNEYKHTDCRTRKLPNCVPVFKGRDVIFTLAPMRRTEFGQAFTVAVKIQNNCDEERYITCGLSINSVFYNAVVASGIKSIKQELVVKPNDVGEVKVEASFEDYYKRTVDEDLIKITTLAIVGKTKQIWSEDYYFLLYKPSLIFEFSKHPVLNEATIMSVTFRNHLKVPITDGTFVVEGSGLLNPKTIRIGDVGPDEQVTMSEEITPMRPDYLNMFATFISKELRGVVGSTTVKVNQREKWLTKFIKTLKHK